MNEVILKADHIYKEFGATKAVTDVSVELCAGEVMGLIGENGSGKSTLSNMIGGVFPPTQGKLFLHGQPYAPTSPLDAKRHGIDILAQEEGSISGITVAENVFLGEEGKLSKLGFVNMKKIIAQTRRILDENGLREVDPLAMAYEYSFETRKMIEVARAVAADPGILIVDETTTALSQKGRERIYEIIKERKAKGRSVVFISHDLDEVMSVCDKVTILRDGHYIATLTKDEITLEKMRSLMIGRTLSGDYYRGDNTCSYDEAVALRVENISYGNYAKDVSFELHKGEILGIGGLTECGMHEVCKLIVGAIKPESGRVTKVEGNVHITSPSIAVANKIAYIPKDRDQESLFQDTSIEDNIVAASLSKVEKGCYISPRKERKLADAMAAKMSVKMGGIKQYVSSLSGGNKQKVAIAKWLANDSEIIIMDCPTRGIDIGVKANIYRLMETLKSEGKAILLVSEEMEELMGMSDRIIVMKDGAVTGQFERSVNLTPYDIVEAMI